MLDDTAFLRNLPRGLHPQDRLALDAAAYAVNSISIAYEGIIERTHECFVLHGRPFKYADQVFCFSQAWSIIDQCHMLMRVLDAFARKNGEIKLLNEFKAKYAFVSAMRNHMDHMYSNLKNLANKKGGVIPVFGALSFYVPQFKVYGPVNALHQPPSGAILTSLVGGSLTHELHHLPTPDMTKDGVIWPSGPYLFSAFDHSLNLNILLRDVGSLCGYFNNTLKNSVMNDAAAKFAKGEIDLKEALEPQSSMPIFQARVEFDPEEIPVAVLRGPLGT